jgi:hypothetical protein
VIMVGIVTGKGQIGIETRIVIEIETGRETVGDHDLQRIGNDGARVTGTMTGGPPQQRTRARRIPEKTQHLIRNVNLFQLKSA